MLNLLILLLLTLHTNLCIGETFEAKVDVTDCEEKCGLSYPTHTYPHADDVNACQRGCRFYIIDRLVDSHSSVKDYCYTSCVEAYNKTSRLTLACQSGCDIEEMNNQKNESDDQKIHLLTPLMQVQEVASKIVGMFHIVKTSVTTYFMSDDEKVVAVKEPVSIMVDVIPPPQLDESKLPPMISTFRARDEPNEILAEEKIPVERPIFLRYANYFMLMLMVAFAYVFIMVICCCPRRHAKKDVHVTTMPRAAMHIKLVRPEDLTKLSLMDDDCLEAGPLPTKVKLPDSSNI